ncbi:hypothetical protein E3J62_06780 [candidate division TA06 bacterium]|uniref:Teneurin-like YD-shell domain-containing protein n=1 Tax=candidate division TA06 bacterium TaxID=2250710 RepID=A0A523USX4_UNCT6|nr:MAG: hypothetical protein E3J62_06780 [candidate division TA06 bacterium]
MPKYFYHHDGLGSIIGMTDKQGSVVQSYRYDEFGRLLQEASPTGPHSNYKYTAQEYDGTISELYNYLARYYEPEIGRFTQEDLITGAVIAPICGRDCVGRLRENRMFTDFPQDLNRYLYVANSPPDWTDPSGFSRYKYCDWLPTIPKALCHIIINEMCKRAHVTYCCGLDLTNCVADAMEKKECQGPEKTPEELLCWLRYYICIGQVIPDVLPPDP